MRSPPARAALRDAAASLAGAAAGWAAGVACAALVTVAPATERGRGAWVATAALLGVVLALAWIGGLLALLLSRRRPGPIQSLVAGGALTTAGFVALLGPSALASPILLLATAAPGLIAGAVYAGLAGPAGPPNVRGAGS